MLDTDACDVQVCCMLLQKEPDEAKKSIAYWSKSLTEAKKPHDRTQQECLKIV